MYHWCWHIRKEKESDIKYRHYFESMLAKMDKDYRMHHKAANHTLQKHIEELEHKYNILKNDPRHKAIRVHNVAYELKNKVNGKLKELKNLNKNTGNGLTSKWFGSDAVDATEGAAKDVYIHEIQHSYAIPYNAMGYRVGSKD